MNKRTPLQCALILCIASPVFNASAQAPGPAQPAPPPQDRYAPAGSPAPSPDRHNLEGIWLNTHFNIEPLKTVEGKSAPYNAKAQAMLQHRIDMVRQGTPVADPFVVCRPAGLLRDLTAFPPMEIVQGGDKIVLMEEDGHSVRIVWMNHRHPKNQPPTYMGHSVGHWEGNTLVVDTIGFNGLTWLDFAGSPHGKMLHVIERIRRVDLGGAYEDLQDLITVEDPDYYTQPWTVLKTYRWRPDEVMAEYNCEENDRAENVEGIRFEDPALPRR